MSSGDDSSTVGKLRVRAFQRCRSRLLRTSPRRDMSSSCQQRCCYLIRDHCTLGVLSSGQLNWIWPYLDVVMSSEDDLGTVGKLRLRAFQRCKSRLLRTSPRRATALTWPYLDVVMSSEDETCTVRKPSISALQRCESRLLRAQPRRVTDDSRHQDP